MKAWTVNINLQIKADHGVYNYMFCIVFLHRQPNFFFLFRSVPQITIIQGDIGNLRNGTEQDIIFFEEFSKQDIIFF